MMTDKPTKAEQEVLDLFLREMRHAFAVNRQMTFTVDPWNRVHGGGANLFVGHDSWGGSWSVEGEFRSRRKRERRSR